LVAALLFGLPALADDGRYVLRVGGGHPAGPTVYTTLLRDFFVPEMKRRVAERTAYQLDFVEGYGGSIAKTAETLEAIEAGYLDIGGYCPCFEPAKLFLHNFAYYAPFGPTDAVVAIEIAREIYDRNPWLAAQFEERYGQTLLALNGSDDYHLGTTVPWNRIEDLKGMKIGGAGPNLPWLKYVGAIPVQSPMPDGYMALQTGVYSGYLLFPSTYFSFRFHEPAPYFTRVSFGAMGGSIVLTINSKRLAKLPPGIRDILFEVGREYEAIGARQLNERQQIGLANLRRAGAIIRDIPAEERASWARSLKGFPDQMAKDADARGMPGSQVMRDYIEVARRHGTDWPVDYTID
jgi:TRAP-type C4-dicarboxylate transport system substrate-binding protein